MIEAKVVADSVTRKGARLTTFELWYPRFIHSELMTHREASRNASSSRAIPVAKQLERIRVNPAMPVYWGKNQPGMQAATELSAEEVERARAVVLEMRDYCLAAVEKLHALGLHKQTANRYLEPWMHIGVVFTICNPSNLFALRYHRAAQPEFQALAKRMYEAYRDSTPVVRPYTGVHSLHLPYVSDEERERCYNDNYALWLCCDTEAYVAGRPPQGSRDVNSREAQKVIQNMARFDLCRMSAARCARVTHLNHDGTAPTWEGDMKTFETLMGGNPKHASPTEHQAWPVRNPRHRSGNLVGWTQFRKTIPGEYTDKFEGPLP